MFDDMVIDINDKIEYFQCSPGDREGVLTYKPDKNTTLFTRWDGIHSKEIDAIAEMKKRIRFFPK